MEYLLEEQGCKQACMEQSIEDKINLILQKLKEINKDIVVIALDGKSASGKTTLADKMGKLMGAGVIHMDDFFLPSHLRTKERLGAPGGNVHYERFKEEILPNLKSGKDFFYHRFDCSKMQLGDKRLVQGSHCYIVEGAYSCHPIFRDYMDIRIFSRIDSKTQLERIRKRNGKEALNNFIEKWIPLEERYFQAYQIYEKADIIV